MEIEILEQQCGGTEFVPRPHRLHLGAQNAEGVDRLQFILPAAWAGCTLGAVSAPQRWGAAGRHSAGRRRQCDG